MQDDGNQQNEPGWVFQPGGPTDTASSENTPSPVAPTLQENEDSLAGTDKSKPESNSESSVQPKVQGAHVEWTASEYIAHAKSSGWFGLLGLGSVAVAAVVFFVTKDVVSTVIIGLLGIIVGIFAARQPKVLRYAVDNTGIHIGERFYPYGSFKSFSVATDQAMGYISLMPLKRFMPPLTIHYDPADEDSIAETLAQYLPFEEYKRDVVDSITRRFRF